MDFHALRARYADCLRDSCSDRDCRLHLDGLPADSLTVIAGGEYQARRNFQGRLADCLIFYEDPGLVAAVVELKSGSIDASVAAEQISNGARVAEGIVSGEPARFFPVLIFGRRSDPLEFKYLRDKRNRIQFRGKSFYIIPGHCDEHLREVVRQYR